jgi:myo-inositol catabolism protein IolC
MGESAQELYGVWARALGIESHWEDLSPEKMDAWRAVAAHVEGGEPVDRRTAVEGMTERHGRLHPEDPGVYAREA